MSLSLLTRHLGNPILTAALALALVLLINHHRPDAAANHRALALEFLHIPPRPSTTGFFYIFDFTHVLLVRDRDRRGGLLLKSAAFGDASAPNSPHNTPILAELRFDYRGKQPPTTGLLAPSFTHCNHTIGIIERTPLTPAQRAHARALYADHLAAGISAHDPTSPLPALLVAGDGAHTTVNPLALAIDAAVILLAALTLDSYAAKPRWLRAAAQRRVPPKGHCPACRYDLTGLPQSTTTCPECGQSTPPA